MANEHHGGVTWINVSGSTALFACGSINLINLRRIYISTHNNSVNG